VFYFHGSNHNPRRTVTLIDNSNGDIGKINRHPADTNAPVLKVDAKHQMMNYSQDIPLSTCAACRQDCLLDPNCLKTMV